MIGSISSSPTFAGKAVIKVDSNKSVNSLKANLLDVARKMGKKDVAYGQINLRSDQIVICGIKKAKKDDNIIHVIVKDNGTDENLVENLRKIFNKKEQVITYQEYLKKF